MDIIIIIVCVCTRINIYRMVGLLVLCGTKRKKPKGTSVSVRKVRSGCGVWYLRVRDAEYLGKAIDETDRWREWRIRVYGSVADAIKPIQGMYYPSPPFFSLHKRSDGLSALIKDTPRPPAVCSHCRCSCDDPAHSFSFGRT